MHFHLFCLKNRKNPNGCPIHATFYVSHEYNNYQYVQKLWNGGHEISAHSITYVYYHFFKFLFLLSKKNLLYSF